jgi:hypothetical protein
MWNTPHGDLPLHPTQIHLFLEMANSLREDLGAEIPLETGIQALDRMSVGEQALAIKTVICQATNPTEPAPDLWAWNEGVIHTLLEQAPSDIEMWKDLARNNASCRKVVKKIEQLVRDAGADPSDPEEIVYQLHPYLLHDEDYMMEHMVQGVAPIAIEMVHERLKIEKDYYLNPGPTGNAADEEAALDWLTCLTGEKEKAPSLEKLAPKIEKLKTGEAVRLTGEERKRIAVSKIGFTCYPLPDDPVDEMLLWKAIPWDGLPLPDPSLDEEDN